MGITDLIPKWLREFFDDPKKIAFILLCLLVIQTYWVFQYREVQKERRLLSQESIKSYKDNFDQLLMLRRMAEDKYYLDRRIDSLLVQIRHIQTVTDSLKPSNLDSIRPYLSKQMDYFAKRLGGIGMNRELQSMRYYDKLLLPTKSIKYILLIALLVILELPLIATLIISWRRRKSSESVKEVI